MYYDHFFKARLTSPGDFLVAKTNGFIARKVLSLLRETKTGKIFEIGHGRGKFADTLHALKGSTDLQYFSIESNRSLTDAGVKKGYAVKCGKIPPLPQDQGWNEFDCIYMAHVLEHFINYEAASTVLSQIASALKPGGAFVLFFPDYSDYHDDFYSVDYSHEYPLTKRRVRDILADNGFTLLSMQSMRACFRAPVSSFLFPLHLAIKFVCGILFDTTGKDVFFKLKITFGRNVLVFARKNEERHEG
jgi:SAM-dependent methyltransferase